jgi:hypothetical protein
LSFRFKEVAQNLSLHLLSCLQTYFRSATDVVNRKQLSTFQTSVIAFYRIVERLLNTLPASFILQRCAICMRAIPIALINIVQSPDNQLLSKELQRGKVCFSSCRKLTSKCTGKSVSRRESLAAVSTLISVNAR